MTQADTWGEALSGAEQTEETPSSVNMLGILQIVISLMAMVSG